MNMVFALGRRKQDQFPECLQNEDINHHWCHSHDVWSPT